MNLRDHDCLIHFTTSVTEEPQFDLVPDKIYDTHEILDNLISKKKEESSIVLNIMINILIFLPIILFFIALGIISYFGKFIIINQVRKNIKKNKNLNKIKAFVNDNKRKLEMKKRMISEACTKRKFLGIKEAKANKKYYNF